ncbi:hypothetical protein [Corynebacterium sp. Marseille-P3884]|uniref:hypothetical protein n=1 Tax=Corynebacterium sp. Marseille-P3884 TaxID=2495409 RepID=UPI001B33CE2A|nr:hypothetical protein [Corynebacterium sp. Marseille-P3884]MBP3948330.1 hypothetical protein [Corynebacterium sp. Marseille-P3884]
MKIRKSILAAATAATVSVSGVVAAPAFAAEPAPKDETPVTAEGTNADQPKDDDKADQPKDDDKADQPKDDDKADQPKDDEGKDNTDQDNGKKKSFGDKLKANSSDKDGDWDPKAITAWISVFTAVLGLVGSVLTFAQKNFKLPF